MKELVASRKGLKWALQKRVCLVDTNIIIRYLIGDDPQKADKARTLMEKVEEGLLSIEIPSIVGSESIWTLEKLYKVPREEIVDKFLSIFSFKGVEGNEKSIVKNALNSYNAMKIEDRFCGLFSGRKVIGKSNGCL